MKIVYLMRHSIPFKEHLGIEINKNTTLLEDNINSPLSVEGEKLAEFKSNLEELKNLDVVWSSGYIRALSTAKYFANKNNLKVNVDYNFGERVHGINLWDELPADFEKKQMLDENYKIGFGESKKEVRDRMYNSLIKLLNEENSKILIVSHSTAISFLLSKWCIINYNGNYLYNNKTFFNGKWDYCEVFKLTFDDVNQLKSIENIK